ncbi:DUF7096 domain-containing protein [Halorussus pelagicus]|uniref:DUF7096 domain-containing protein n=1 Tax=Halorussus pelagicus TaxID=2505977 RepID=UPI000FFC28CC|nr:hypothetical protein [Halorussus pelagicus]
MKPTFLVLLTAVGLALVTGVAVADQSAGPTADGPELPGEETTTNESDGGEANDETNDESKTTPGLSPGQRLTGAVGAQGASVQGELLNRSLSERLANATTPAQRAQVVADENESLAAYLDALEGVRENITTAWEADDLSEGRYRAALAEFVVRARTVELRANRTARAAEELPESVRETHAINATRIRDLGERARELYRFEEPIAREVANQTVENNGERALPVERPFNLTTA